MLHFVDSSGDLVRELRRLFAGVDEVACADGDILAVARNAIVSPANSYGFMDGGLDASYADFFGPRLQVAVQEAIKRVAERPLAAAQQAVAAAERLRRTHSIVPRRRGLPPATSRTPWYDRASDRRSP